MTRQREATHDAGYVFAVVLRGFLFFIGLALVASPAVAQDDEYLRNPSHLKQDILKSFIFQARDIFYPTGSVMAIDVSHHPLSPQQKKLLDSRTTSLFNELLDLYAKRRNALAIYFHKPLPESLNIKLRIIDETDDMKGARVVQVGQGVELQVSRALLAANYRACLMTASRNLAAIANQIEHDDTPTQTSTEVSEADALRAIDTIRLQTARYNPSAGSILERIGEVFGSKNVSSFAEMLNAKDMLSGKWDNLFERYGVEFLLIDEARVVSHMDKQFFGTILFALAHEMGHYTLGTMDSKSETPEDEKKEAELDADRFATFFLSETFMRYGVRRVSSGFNIHMDLLRGTTTRTETGPSWFFFEPDYAEDCLGYATFFDKGYDLTFTSDNGPDWYPKAQERREASEKVYTYVYVYLSDSITQDIEDKYNRNLLSKILFNGLKSSLFGGL
jgi:hypothetical protein